MEAQRKGRIFPVLLAFVSLTASVVLLVTTPWGLGLSPDSAVYVGAARSLMGGQGMAMPADGGRFAPIAHYPPLFPTLLAAAGLAGADLAEGARWLNALLFGGNVTLAGVLVHACTRSWWFSLASASLMAVSSPVIRIHSWLWTEPLFVFFALTGIFFLAGHLERPSATSLCLAAWATAMAFLARYAGLALVATGAVGLLLQSKQGWRDRSKATTLFLAIACLPMILWLIRNMAAVGSATNRVLTFHPPTVEHLKSAADTLSTWCLPAGGFPEVALLALGTVLGLCLARLVGAARRAVDARPLSSLSCVLSAFILSYVSLILASLTFLDAQIPLNDRILSPAYIGGLILASCLWGRLAGSGRIGRTGRGAGMVLWAVLFVLHSHNAVSWFGRLYDGGLGYSSIAWRDSGLVRYVNASDDRTPIFTNAPDAIYALMGRPAYMIPRKMDPSTKTLNGRYLQELERMGRRLKEERGRLVYFDQVHWRWYLPSAQELAEELGLDAVIRFSDGVVYQPRGVP